MVMMVRRPVVLIVQSAYPRPGLEVRSGESCLTIRTGQAEDAYDIARREQPAVVAVDVSLEDGTGWALCRLLKRDPLTASIPVVVLGDAENDVTTEHARFIGASAVFTAPTSVDALLDAVQDTLVRSSAA
jgi:CheY-like chemotaxis protein